MGRAATTSTRPHLGHLRLRLRPPRGALLVLLVVAAAATALVPSPRLLRRSSSTRWTSHGARATCRPHNEDHRTDPPPSIAKPLGMLGHGGSVLGAICAESTFLASICPKYEYCWLKATQQAVGPCSDAQTTTTETHETTPNMNDIPEETESTGTENSREAALPSSPSSWELGRSQQRQRAAATTRGETNTQPTDLAASSTFELQHGPRPMTIRAIPSGGDRSKFGRRGVCVWEGWVEWGGGGGGDGGRAGTEKGVGR